jgi:uncharacterized protein YaeQ
MALPSTIYRARIQLADIDQNRYATLQGSVARHPSETAERLVVRLLAWALSYEPDLAFTKGICAGDEPDLWLKGPDGRVKLWIEVGLPDPERLTKACRRAEEVVLYACGPSRPTWERLNLPKLQRLSNFSLRAIPQDFLQQLVARLERSVDWELTLTEGTIYLNVAGVTLETRLELPMD